MKKHILYAVSVISVLTAGLPIWAQSSTTASGGSLNMTIEGAAPERLSDYGLSINPQIGSSSFEYTGKNKNASSGLSGGVTVEFGQAVRKFETGLVFIEMAKSGYITIPMMAKIRLVSMRAQSYYAKFGFAAAFEAVGRQSEASNSDVLAGLGIGGRAAITDKIDLLIEGTYHRGMLNAYTNANPDNIHNQGFLILTGLSLAL